MREIRDQLEGMLQELQLKQKNCSEEINKCPEGRLYLGKSHGRDCYYHATESDNGGFSQPKRKVISQDSDLAKALAHKEFMEQMQKYLLRDICQIRNVLKHINDYDAEALMRMLPRAYKNLPPEYYQSGAPSIYREGTPQVHQSGAPNIHREGTPQMHQSGAPSVHREGTPQVHQTGSPNMPQTDASRGRAIRPGNQATRPADPAIRPGNKAPRSDRRAAGYGSDGTVARTAPGPAPDGWRRMDSGILVPERLIRAARQGTLTKTQKEEVREIQREWANMKYEVNTKNLEQKNKMTSRGLMTRSLSEVSIIERIYNQDIPFRYDQVIRIGTHEVSPDLSFLSITRGVIWWEHCGMTHSDSYIEYHRYKRRLYESAGFVPWENYIETYNEADSFLDIRMIDAIIENTLLRWLHLD